MVEQKIEDLKKKMDQYENMKDTGKINNIQNYNELIKELNSCKIILAASKNTFKNIETFTKDSDVDNDNSKKKKGKKNNKEKDDTSVEYLMESVKDIKKQLDSSNLTLQEMIHLYAQFIETKLKLTDILKNKEMEIIKVEQTLFSQKIDYYISLYYYL